MSEKAKLILVRHGEVDWNVTKRYVGQTNLSLNDKGKKQARQLAEDISDSRINRIFCSPLLRAKETLDPILKFHEKISPIIDNRLIAKSHGHLEGILVSEAEDLFPEYKGIDFTNKRDLTPTGGESMAEVKERVVNFLENLNCKENEIVLIVTHMVVIRLINEYFNNENEKLGFHCRIPKCKPFEIPIHNQNHYYSEEKKVEKWAIVK